MRICTVSHLSPQGVSSKVERVELVTLISREEVFYYRKKYVKQADITSK